MFNFFVYMMKNIQNHVVHTMFGILLLSYYVTLPSEFRVVISGTNSAYKRFSVRV
jgi:hypothetical protein